MSYSVVLTKAASRQLAKLNKPLERRLLERLAALAQNPYEGRISKPLVMDKTKRSSRVSDWRIIFRVHDDLKVVDILAIAHRSQVYQDI